MFDPTFGISLLSVNTAKLNESELNDLKGNCAHVIGPYWIMEGWVEALEAFNKIKIVATGTTGCYGDMSKSELMDHLEDHNCWKTAFFNSLMNK